MKGGLGLAREGVAATVLAVELLQNGQVLLQHGVALLIPELLKPPLVGVHGLEGGDEVVGKELLDGQRRTLDDAA